MDMQVAALDILITKGGFAPAAARAIGEAMDLQIARSYDDLATNQRLDETRLALNSEIDGARLALNSKIDQLRMEFQANITTLEVKLISAFAVHKQEVRIQIEEAKTQFWRWMIWIMMGQTAAVAGILRLFMPHGP
jgi:hypothetical protein